MPEERYMSIYDGLIGALVGDVIGVPVAFQPRLELMRDPVIGPRGFGTYRQPAGTWSDVGSLLLATTASLTRCGLRVNCGDLMDSFSAWYFDAAFTPHDRVFVSGNTAVEAINQYQSGIDPIRCGGSGLRHNGSGSLCRMLPLAYTACSDTDIANASSLTHAHVLCRVSCILFVRLVRALLAARLAGRQDDQRMPQAQSRKLAVIRSALAASIGQLGDLKDRAVNDAVQHYDRLAEINGCEPSDIQSSQYVVDAFESALWAFMTTSDYEQCVLAAVNLGDDTNRIGSLAGGLAGIWYGSADIPADWLACCSKRPWIEDLCDAFDRCRQNL